MHANPFEIPHHSVREFSPRRTKYCLCIFVLNEGDRIRAQLQKTKSFAKLLDIVIADGGSVDGSIDPAFVGQQNIRTLLVKHDVGGLSAQMRMAFAYALQEGYEGIVVMDGNNKDDPEAIPLFVRALQEGFDHVQGSRFMKGGKQKHTRLFRFLTIKFLHAPLIRWSSGFPYTDTTNGFRAYSRKLLLEPRIKVFRSIFSRYELHYYLAIRAAELKYRIKEVPVTRSYPSKGVVSSKINSVKGYVLILKTLLKACFHQFDPEE